jgi:4-hydroxy-tetrahydrodipicolinate synthase
MRALTTSTLKGLWAAVPTPFQAGGKIDFGLLRENCARLARAGVDGIYTTDSDGEFYAIEIDEFRQVAVAFARAMQGLQVDAAMGVTWANTRGVIDRLRAALEAGIPNAHVGLPFYMPLAARDLPRYFEELAEEVPEGRWIHYAHPSFRPALTGSDLNALQRAHPANLIGTKLAGHAGMELAETLLGAPGLAHFAGDTNLLPACLLGARGSYSYWVNTMPVWTRKLASLCFAGDYAAAAPLQRKLLEWELTAIAPLRRRGYRHGILGKSRGRLTGFLRDDGSTRAPYLPLTKEEQDTLDKAFLAFWREELASEPTW